jgi:type VI secretion system secreted protein Hcp
MASDIFIKFDGIEGESEDGKHAKEIDVISWSVGVSQTGTMAVGGGGGSGKAQFNDFHFVHAIDQASPALWLKSASGDHIKSATLTVRKAGKEQQEYFIVKLTDMIVTSVQLGDTAADGGKPTESISLNFAKIEYDYKVQKSDGTLGAPIKFGWNVKKNEKV